MNLPIYELLINEDLNNEAEVSYVALVDEPAIKKDFLAFKNEFIEPSKGEHQDEFLKRCIKYVIDEGKESEQAVAICNSLWEQHFAEDSYNDYPKEASKNAQIALDYAEKNGWGDCGTPVGKIRANQLAKGESISRDTIARMSAFERHRQNSQKKLGDGCGRLMWLAWGGDAGIEWASRKLEQIDKEKMAANKISFDYDDTLSTSRGKELAKKLIDEGNVVYIISARDSKDGMLSTAKELGIPESRVYATGSNSAKVEKIKELGINKHYDNNPDVVKQLENVGIKFYEVQQFAIVNEEQRIISGALMIADELIYRNNEKFGEHYVKFSAETIKQIAIKFAKKKYQNHVNLMHNPDLKVDGVTMFESFIVDKKRGIQPMAEFSDVADGSWFGSFYVENDEVWNAIKSGQYKGFSVEGMFDYTEPDIYEDKLNEIRNLLFNLYDKFGGLGSGRHSEGGDNEESKISDANSKAINKDYSNENNLNENVKLLNSTKKIDTEKLYKDKNTNDYNSERKKLHTKISEEYLSSGSTNLGTSIFMGGAPATGKSSIVSSGDVTLPKGILVIDSDEIKKKIPEYNKMVSKRNSKSASKVHEESSMLSKGITKDALEKGYDIVNDGVGDGSYESVVKKVEEQRKNGKKVVAHYVTTDIETSLKRAHDRGLKTGRIVPKKYIKEMHSEISHLVPQLAKNGIFDEITLYDTNSNKPKKIMSAKGKIITIHDKNAYDKFLKKAKPRKKKN